MQNKEYYELLEKDNTNPNNNERRAVKEFKLQSIDCSLNSFSYTKNNNKLLEIWRINDRTKSATPFDLIDLSSLNSTLKNRLLHKH